MDVELHHLGPMGARVFNMTLGSLPRMPMRVAEAVSHVGAKTARHMYAEACLPGCIWLQLGLAGLTVRARQPVAVSWQGSVERHAQNGYQLPSASAATTATGWAHAAVACLVWGAMCSAMAAASTAHGRCSVCHLCHLVTTPPLSCLTSATHHARPS